MKKGAKKRSAKTAKKRKAPLRRVKRTLRKISKKVFRKSPKKNKIGAFSKSVPSRVSPKSEPAQFHAAHPGGFELPSSYHENRLTLLVRDPWWIFAFWEVTPEREKEVLREIFGKGLQKDKTVLRVYEVTGKSIAHANSSFDIELNFFADNWYIDVGKPDKDWAAELGIRATNGSFFPLVRSNTVKTPRFGLSDVLDEEWMMPDELYWKLFGRMAGLSGRKSSLNVREVLERYLKSMVSSEGLLVK